MRLTKEQIEALSEHDYTSRTKQGTWVSSVLFDDATLLRALRTQARIDALSDEQRAFLREYAEEEREIESSDWMCLQYMDGPSHESCAEAWSAIIAIMGDDK